MDYLKPVLATLLVAMSLTTAGARAQEPALAPDTPAAGTPAKPAAEAPIKPAPPPNRKPIKRRSVQQVIEPTPPIVTDGYRPTLTVRSPAALPSASPPQSQPRLNSCDAGGCTDTGGARYNSGVGNTLIGPQGQLCTKGIVGAQCF
ncbi:hypothetical protein [Massilia eurypsychrophila]|nr:hypothetical protein [Massilia eurypsychrophila]